MIAHDPAVERLYFTAHRPLWGFLQIQNKDINSICSTEVGLRKLRKCFWSDGGIFNFELCWCHTKVMVELNEICFDVILSFH